MTVLSGVGTHTYRKWQLTAILNCAFPEQQLGLHPGRTHHSKSTFSSNLHSSSTPALSSRSDAVTDLVPSYCRTNNFIFFFSSSISTIVYLHFYTTLYWTPIVVKHSSQYIWKQAIKIPTVHRTCSLEDVTAPLTDQRGKTKGERRHFKLCSPAKRSNSGLSSHWGKHFYPKFFRQVWAHKLPVKSHFSNAASWEFYR